MIGNESEGDRNDWQDYWMDYKNFKSIIADIEKEKKEKEEKEAAAAKNETENKESIDISIMLFSVMICSFSRKRETLLSGAYKERFNGGQLI